MNNPPKMKPVSVLLVDDHALIRRGLTDLIRYESDLNVAGEASNGQEAVEAARKLNPDVIVMDLMMPEMDGVEATRRIKAERPDSRILILTTFGTSADVARAMAAGASGAIMKDAETDDQLAAIRAVAAGGKAFSPGIEKALNELQPTPDLTDRQLLILESVTRGLTNRDIATMLGISADAVKQHLAAIFSKLGAANRSEAISIALRKHLLKLGLPHSRQTSTEYHCKNYRNCDSDDSPNHRKPVSTHLLSDIRLPNVFSGIHVGEVFLQFRTMPAKQIIRFFSFVPRNRLCGKMRLFRSMNGNARLVEIGNDRRDNICETADFVIEKTYAIQHAIQQNVTRIEICAF